MNKIILFDWGGLILKEYPNHYCDRDAISDTLRTFNKNLSYDEAYKIYEDTRYDENHINISRQDSDEDKYKWYERIKKKANLNVSYDNFVKVFEENYKRIAKYDDIVKYIYSLKGKVKIGLFSDLLFVCLKALKDQIDLDVFDNVFLSYEEHWTKARLEAFENVENKLKMHGKEILFIDNSENKIENAKKFNWNTCLATGEELDKIKKAVNEFLEN